MVRTAIVLLAIPSMLCAQPRPARLTVNAAPAAVVAPRNPPPVPAMMDTGATARLPRSVVADSAGKPTLLRYTLTGLGIGAAIGAAGGAIGSRYAGCSCSDIEFALWFATWFGAIGAGAGALVGAAVGLLHGR